MAIAMNATTPRRRRRAFVAALAVGAALTVSGGSLAASAAAAPAPAPVDPLALVTNLLGNVLSGIAPSATGAPAALAKAVSGLPTDAVTKLVGGTDLLGTVLGALGAPLDLVGNLVGPKGPLGGGLSLLG
jgi:hypothetical protein